ncbi:MAG: hypothetical protein FJX36_14105 [Alphaproteobacteria bacterium]|nr:hypothetical protein [Alphaproteobacteria bacterium]
MRNSAFDRRRLLAAAPAGVAAVTLGGWSRGARAADDLVVFDWTGYQGPELHAAYIEKYGASPPVTMYADMDEAFLKVQGGFRPDLIHPNVWDVRRFYDAGFL